VEQGGCLDSVETRPHGRSSEKREEKAARRKSKDQLGHRRKNGGDDRCARVRVHP
jgi:hypothetical protein